jgi:hypothetical protein
MTLSQLKAADKIVQVYINESVQKHICQNILGCSFKKKEVSTIS